MVGMPTCEHWAGERGDPEPHYCGRSAPFMQRDRRYVHGSYIHKCEKHLIEHNDYWIVGLDAMPEDIGK